MHVLFQIIKFPQNALEIKPFLDVQLYFRDKMNIMCLKC